MKRGVIAAAALVTFVGVLFLLHQVWKEIDTPSGPSAEGGSDDALGSTTGSGTSSRARGGSTGSGALSSGSAEQATLSMDGSGVEVSGTVVEVESRHPVAGIEVTFRSATGGEATVTSGADGHFTTKIPLGNYQLRAIGPGIPSLGARKLRLTDRAQPTEGLTIEVAHTVHLSGRVVGTGGETIADAELSASSKLGTKVVSARDLQRWSDIGSTISDASGKYSMEAVAGDVTVTARAPDGAAGEGTVSAPTGGQTYELDIVVPPGANLSGLVQDARGTGIAGATVQVAHVEPGSSAKDRNLATTDDKGRFSIAGIRPGRVSIEATAPGYATSAPKVEIFAPAAERRVTIELGTGQSVSGRVVDGDGSPLAGVLVKAFIRGSRLMPSATSDESGKFQIEGLGAGPYELVAYQPYGAKTRVFDVRPPTSGLEIRFAANGLRGSVRASSGALPARLQARVTSFIAPDGRARSKAGPPIDAVVRGSSFEIPLSTPGTYVLVISAKGFASQSVSAVVPRDDWGRLDLALQPAASLSGRTVDRDTGRAVAGARLVPVGPYEGAGATSDDDGRFRLDSLGEGRLSIRISHPAYGSQVKTVQVGGNGDITIELAHGGH